jgi:3-keto-5-aminohexanoate cleavage enzyme
MEPAAFQAAAEAIRGASDLIVQFTTGGSVTDTETARAAPLRLKPEMATLTPGSVNFGDDVFLNRPGFVRELYSRMIEAGILPEFEIFEAGMIAIAKDLVAFADAQHHLHFDLVVGARGAFPAIPGAVGFLSSLLPDEASWSATGIGRFHPDIALTTLRLGGHVRTGMEDVRYLSKGVPVRTNRELVHGVSTWAREMGREIASPALARELLGLGASPIDAGRE